MKIKIELAGSRFKGEQVQALLSRYPDCWRCELEAAGYGIVAEGEGATMEAAIEEALLGLS